MTSTDDTRSLALRRHVDFDVERPHRVRTAGDVVRLLIGLLMLVGGFVLAVAAEETVGGLEADLVEAFTELPDRVEQLLVGLAQVIATAMPLALGIVLLLRRRVQRLVVLLVGSALAGLAMHGLDGLLETREVVATIAGQSVREGWLSDPGFPSSAYIAASAAIVTLASTYLTRGWKRAAWGAVVVLLLLRIVTSSDPALDVLLAISVGVVVASLLLVGFGAPNPEPDRDALVQALAPLVPDLVAVRSAPERAGTTAFLVDDEHRRVYVKLRTPDDRSADLLNRLWRATRLRSSEVRRPYATVKRRMEHEALLLSQAVAAGVRSPALVGMSTTPEESVLLASEAIGGRTLAALDTRRLDEDLLDDMWRQVRRLHEARIAHRDLRLANLVLDDDGRPWLVEYDDAELSAPRRERARDVSQLLVELALVIGPRRAVGPAVAELGPEAVAAALPLLQPLAMPAETRRVLRRRRGLLDDLRAEVCRQTGAEEVEPERLERVRPRTVVSIVALSVAFYVLLPQIADIEQTVEAFGDADLPWIPAILGFAALTFVFAAVSFVGSVAERIPYVPALRAQLAASFAGLVAPARVGGIGIGLRFLQRSGIESGAATAAVSLNQVAGVVVHLGLMAGFFAWTGRSGVGGFSLPETATIALVAAVVLGAAGIALLFRPVRRAVLERTVAAARSGWASIAGVFTSPGRVGALFGGSLGITLAFIGALVAAVEAFGGGLTVPQIGAAYLGASIIGAVAPTPGGLGAVEAALVAALTGFGLPSGVAVSATLSFRLATYWLPMLPGWGAFTWMQHRGEL